MSSLPPTFSTKLKGDYIDLYLLPLINSLPSDQGTMHRMRDAVNLMLDKGDKCRLFVPKRHETTFYKVMIDVDCCPKYVRQGSAYLLEAINILGSDSFRVHPKGHGAVCLSRDGIPPHTLVTFYRGEVYPSWRWSEKTEAITITQRKVGMKPNLPDFYNMAMERPKSDPTGFGLLFVDASRKASMGSQLSHSCNPTCEVKVVSKDGALSLAMITVRSVSYGEELTFDYGAVTDSIIEYQAAICLCGSLRCRGSFLHFAAADQYQTILKKTNRWVGTRGNREGMRERERETDERVFFRFLPFFVSVSVCLHFPPLFI